MKFEMITWMKFLVELCMIINGVPSLSRWSSTNEWMEGLSWSFFLVYTVEYLQLVGIRQVKLSSSSSKKKIVAKKGNFLLKKKCCWCHSGVLYRTSASLTVILGYLNNIWQLCTRYLQWICRALACLSNLHNRQIQLLRKIIRCCCLCVWECVCCVGCTVISPISIVQGYYHWIIKCIFKWMI